MSEPFTFGIPLIAQAAARNWQLVDHLLDLTLASVLAQSDGDFRVLLAGHDAPPSWRERTAGDRRFEILAADWPPEAPTAANDDGGRKKWRIKQAVRAAGGGLLMFLDADDWVDRDLVRIARATMRPQDVGALVANGLALDFQSLKAAPFPLAGLFDGPFHGLCGSSTIGRIDPQSDDPVRRDPHQVLGSHHEWQERAAAGGHPLALLDVWGLYMVGTTRSHSEDQGPFAPWRRQLSEGVRAIGKPIDEAGAMQFGVPFDRLPSSAAARRHLCGRTA